MCRCKICPDGIGEGAGIAADVKAGFVETKGAVDPAFLSETQPHQVTKKRFVKARYKRMQQAGSLAPETFGLRVDKLSRGNSTDENEAQKIGAYDRVQKLVRRQINKDA